MIRFGLDLRQTIFRAARVGAVIAGLLLSLLAVYDWLATFAVALREPLAILPDASKWDPVLLGTTLADTGLPAGSFAALALTLTLVFNLAFLVCGWLILWRRSRDWFGLYLGLILLIWADGVGIFYSVPPVDPRLENLKMYIAWIGWPGLFLVLYYFPSGHVTPRWARWFAGLLGGFIVYGMAATAGNFEVFNVSFAFSIIIPCLLVGGYAQVYRFRHAEPVERQQVKWVVLALLVYILLFIGLALLLNVLRIDDPASSNPASALLASIGLLVGSNLAYIGLPLSITLAMLRFRLWDVDVVIRRTLQYTLLTALLALAYFGAVVVLQAVFGGLAGGSSSPPLVTVISTLGIAALFNPLRARTRNWIDRRFYRTRYDAEQVLSDFAAAARNEVDLDRLISALTHLAQIAMQPQTASVWMKRPVSKTTSSPAGKAQP